MPLVLANRVQESGTANTTVSFTLTGAVTGFQSFSTIGNGNTTYYSATDAAGNWEVGLGLYLATGSILVRTAVYESSNAGSAVTFSGAVNVFVTLPSGSAIYEDASGNASPLGTVTSGTWQGSTVGVAYGGTGVTASSGPNSVVLRDANENITINRLNQGLQTVTASGGVTALTAASDFNQALVGTGGHTYSLPDATMLSDTTAFQFNNNATGTLTITDYASATVGTIAPGGAAGVALLNNSTVGGTWDVHAYIPENVTWGTNALALGTTVVSGGTWQGGTIQSGYGGTGLTTFAGANNALYSTSASALAAGTLPVAAGGTGLTSYTLNGVVYASGTGTLATGSALTFDGTNLINTGAYTAPNNGAGAGTKTTIRGSTGTGQASATGGNGFIELIGGGGTSAWTAFGGALARRRGGIYLQAGTAQADAGGTYVSGSTINILGSAGTNNGTLTGFGSAILIQSGTVTKTDGQTNTAASINLASSSSTAGSSALISAGNFNTSAGSNNGSSVTVAAGAATTGGSITLFPGNATVSGSTVGKAYVRDPATATDNEILTTNRIVAGTNITVTNSSGFLTIAASGGGSPALPAARGTVYGYMSNAGDGSQVSLGQYTPGAPTTSWPGYPEWNANVATTANGTNALASATGVVQSNVMFSTGTGYSPGTWTYPVNGTNAYGISDYITYSLTVTIDSTGQVMSATVVVTGYASGFNPFRGFVDDPYYNIYLSDYPFAPWGNGNNDGQVTVSMYYERASYNTAIGAYTLSVLNSSGANQYGNTAVGAYAASGLVGGSANTAIGSYALTNAANGEYNVAIGTAAGQNGNAPAANVFIGYAAGFSYESNGSVIIGYEAGRNATYGSGNTFIGTAAGYSVNSGNNNTFVGRDSGYFVTSGYGHTIIGCHNGIGNGLNISTLSNYIVLSDGNGSARIAVDSSGRTQFRSNVVMPYQGTPTTKAAAATLTGAELATGLLNTTGTTYTITLPTGTNIEGAIAWSNTNVCLDWFVINTASGAITIAANGNSTLGSLTIATGVSAHFRIRRTAANTFTVYRLT